jgi:hypothetical protein
MANYMTKLVAYHSVVYVREYVHVTFSWLETGFRSNHLGFINTTVNKPCACKDNEYREF